MNKQLKGPHPGDLSLLTPEEMARADQVTIETGLSGYALMKAAGGRVAEIALEMLGGRVDDRARIACLAGPGNNGGDAFIAAQFLRRAGWRVSLFCLAAPADLKGDAAKAAAFHAGNIEDLSAFDPDGFSLIIDGLFGAGLSRPLDGKAADIVERTNASSTRVLAIDLPSGVSGGSGEILGTAFDADRTVTFFRAKPGHYVEPGRSKSGLLVVRQIGIEPEVLDVIEPATWLNGPALWLNRMSLPSADGHKYDRGHAVVFSGVASKTGAARLSAQAALRSGAGLVTVFSPASAILVHAVHLTAVMLQRCESADELEERLADKRLNAFVLGPGFGIGDGARDYTTSILQAKRLLLLDADGISSFADAPEMLFDLARDAAGEAGPKLVLTPHEGEFRRLFPDLADPEADNICKLERAREAARRSHAVVVLKGRDTVIAAPDGRAAINASGTPWLATAGTGDVLTGIICAQLAQGTPPFEAACAGVWMHGRAAELFGPGLIAEDMETQMPAVFQELIRKK